MTEKLMHYIWQFGYFNQSALFTSRGEVLELLNRGQLNHHQGPDFLDARVRIGSTILAGSIELHLKASDWKKHGHESDINYRSVILHVVMENDLQEEPVIPVLELQSRVSAFLLERYERLMNQADFIPCAESISKVREITWTAWKERLVVERLIQRSEHILQLVEETKGHWEEACWWMLARNFGLPVNGDSFESLARSLPISTLARHKQQIHQLEGLLFGQAGMLSRKMEDSYEQLLFREYRFLSQKYNLKPVHEPFHFLRMRPVQFPTVRLAQLAMILHLSKGLFRFWLEAESPDEIRKGLKVTANDFWHYHYRFGQESAFQPKQVGADMVNSLLINTVCPMVFAYGFHHKNEGYRKKALDWLQEIKKEENRITKGFRNLDIKCKNAFDSQAVLQLKKEYCDCRRCLECAIGHSILKSNEVITASQTSQC